MDAEEWFHVPGREDYARPERWGALEPSFPRALECTLDLLQEGGWRATFFVLGWLARRYPGVVRRIAEKGHELACHGMEHRLVGGMTPADFARDLVSAKVAIEEACGLPLAGFRAPCWSMPRAAWPYEVLAEQGFAYSSSRLAIAGLGGGDARVARVCEVLELPALSAGLRPLAWPAGGTVALRTAPLPLLARARDRALRAGRPAVYWFHPWELDAEAPRASGGALFRWARYTRLDRLPGRLKALVPPGDRRLGPLAARVDSGPSSGDTDP